MEKIQFKVSATSRDENVHADIYIEGQDGVGLRHVTPWSTVVYSYFGARGNLGKQVKFGRSAGVELTDPLKAQQEIGISSGPLVAGETVNDPATQYFVWLNALRAKYIDYLVAHVSEYPVLAKKYEVLIQKGDTDSIRGMLDQACPQLVKQPKEVGPGKSPLVGYRQRLYIRTSPERASKIKPRCDLDAEMKEKHAVRNHVPLYDSHGKQIPLDMASVGAGDVVAVQCTVLPQVYDVGGNVGASLKLQLRGVVLLRQRTVRRTGSPFGDNLIPGGVVFSDDKQ